MKHMMIGLVVAGLFGCGQREPHVVIFDNDKGNPTVGDTEVDLSRQDGESREAFIARVKLALDALRATDRAARESR